MLERYVTFFVARFGGSTIFDTRKDSLRVVGLIYLYAALVPTVLKAQTSPIKKCVELYVYVFHPIY